MKAEINATKSDNKLTFKYSLLLHDVKSGIKITYDIPKIGNIVGSVGEDGLAVIKDKFLSGNLTYKNREKENIIKKLTNIVKNKENLKEKDIEYRCNFVPFSNGNDKVFDSKVEVVEGKTIIDCYFYMDINDIVLPTREVSVRDMHKAIWILEVYSSSLPHYTSFLEMTMNILFTNDTSKYIGSPLYELYNKLFYVYSNEMGDIESKCQDIVSDFIGKYLNCASRINSILDGDLDSFESYEDDFVNIELFDENVLEDGKLELVFCFLNKIDGSNIKEKIILE